MAKMRRAGGEPAFMYGTQEWIEWHAQEAKKQKKARRRSWFKRLLTIIKIR